MTSLSPHVITIVTKCDHLTLRQVTAQLAAEGGDKGAGGAGPPRPRVGGSRVVLPLYMKPMSRPPGSPGFSLHRSGFNYNGGSSSIRPFGRGSGSGTVEASPRLVARIQRFGEGSLPAHGMGPPHGGPQDRGLGFGAASRPGAPGPARAASGPQAGPAGRTLPSPSSKADVAGAGAAAGPAGASNAKGVGSAKAGVGAVAKASPASTKPAAGVKASPAAAGAKAGGGAGAGPAATKPASAAAAAAGGKAAPAAAAKPGPAAAAKPGSAAKPAAGAKPPASVKAGPGAAGAKPAAAGGKAGPAAAAAAVGGKAGPSAAPAEAKAGLAAASAAATAATAPSK